MTLRDQLGKPILFHWLPWHNKDGKSLTGYDSRDPNVITNQLYAMRQLGGDGCGVIALTYGPTVSPFIHQAVMNMGNQCNAMGMPFALCMDPWTCSKNGVKVPASPANSAMIIAALQHPDMQFLMNMNCYLKGKPVLDFATGADKQAVLNAVPGIEWWQKQVDFDWVMIPQVPNKTPLPCIYIQFDDGTGADCSKSWSDQTKPVRIIPAMGGNTFWNRDVSGAKDYVQFVTWNDVNEQTDVEKFASMISERIY